jgi:hypothetical protein
MKEKRKRKKLEIEEKKKALIIKKIQKRSLI